ncbi:MAG: Spy/CpxP family protein refolding chaperone [Armatimonadota bacterium]
MKTRWVIAGVVIAMAITAGVVLNAAPRWQGQVGAGQNPAGTGTAVNRPVGAWWCGPFPQRLVVQLGLTDQQVAELRQIQQDFLTATQADRTNLLAKAKQMTQLWSTDQPDINAIRALAAEIDELRARIRDAAIDNAASALTVLTGEQREKLRSLIKNRWPLCGCCGWCIGYGGCGLGLGPGYGFGNGPGAGMGLRGSGMTMGPGWGNGTGPRGGTPMCPLYTQ